MRLPKWTPWKLRKVRGIFLQKTVGNLYKMVTPSVQLKHSRHGGDIPNVKAIQKKFAFYKKFSTLHRST